MRKSVFVLIALLLASPLAGAAQALWSDGTVGSIHQDESGAVARAKIEAVHRKPASQIDTVLDQAGLVARAKIEAVHRKPASQIDTVLDQSRLSII